jgi:hypothetical protein
MRFTLFRNATESAGPAWRNREAALLWGVPMVLFSALSFIPVAVSLILVPAFPHARVLGAALVPVLGCCLTWGVSRLAACFGRDFDVLSLFAGGAVVVFLVICICAGVILASAIGR